MPSQRYCQYVNDSDVELWGLPFVTSADEGIRLPQKLDRNKGDSINMTVITGKGVKQSKNCLYRARNIDLQNIAGPKQGLAEQLSKGKN